MPKYGIGDRVEHDDFGYGNVIAIDIDDWIGVEFDHKNYGLHSCTYATIKEGHSGKMGHCYWITEEDPDLRLIEKAEGKEKKMAEKYGMEIKKVSYDRSGTNGKTVTCRLEYFVVAPNGLETTSRVVSGEANCAPDDTFDFKVGMDLAYDRAYAKAVEVAKKMNFPEMRFVCVKSNDYFQSGTIYPIHYDNNNKPYVIDRNGDRRPNTYQRIGKERFLGFMGYCNMVKLED